MYLTIKEIIQSLLEYFPNLKLIHINNTMTPLNIKDQFLLISKISKNILIIYSTITNFNFLNIINDINFSNKIIYIYYLENKFYITPTLIIDPSKHLKLDKSEINNYSDVTIDIVIQNLLILFINSSINSHTIFLITKTNNNISIFKLSKKLINNNKKAIF